MATDPRTPYLTSTRFGLGPRPGELAAIGGDPVGWLDAQLDGPAALEPQIGDTATRLALGEQMQVSHKGEDLDARAQAKDLRRDLMIADHTARSLVQTQTTTPFRERWVAHWSNHFTVSSARHQISLLCGPYERDAIRPHVTGRFLDLLSAATTHPAMLFYLDNTKSMGPNSKTGAHHDKGLNENLARELLELHTLGVDGGYTQEDVEALACVLTGWTVETKDGPPGVTFSERRHEPGPRTLLGQTLPDVGPDQLKLALALLASHPSTAKNVATRLARHFYADDPPERVVHKLTKVFRDTEGDLREVGRAVARLEPEPLSKVKQPWELAISTARVLDVQDGAEILQGQRFLGQLPFSAPSPKGWSDVAMDWTAAEQMMQRVEYAERAAHKLGDARQADLAAALEPVLSPRTRSAVSTTDHPLAMLLASPEFQRR